MKRILLLLSLAFSIVVIQQCKSVDVSRTNPDPIDTTKYSCQGKTTCTEMISCNEAKFYLKNCPNVTTDGDEDGIPCEGQWCVNP